MYTYTVYMYDIQWICIHMRIIHNDMRCMVGGIMQFYVVHTFIITYITYIHYVYNGNINIKQYLLLHANIILHIPLGKKL